MNEKQYELVCARRQSYDSLLWEVPSLAIAAQAFLLAAAIGSTIPKYVAVFLALVSIGTGLASFQVMQKHRQLEKEDAERLSRFESSIYNRRRGYVRLHGRGLEVPGVERNWFAKKSAFRVWSFVLVSFVALGLIALMYVATKEVGQTIEQDANTNTLHEETTPNEIASEEVTDGPTTQVGSESALPSPDPKGNEVPSPGS